MSQHPLLSETSWLFELGFPMYRFDVMDSPTGIVSDLSWTLPERYTLPRLTAIEKKPEDAFMDLRGAWHEKGLFFQMPIPDYMMKSFSESTRERPALLILVFINTRYAPGIHRANANSTLIAFDFPWSRKMETRNVILGQRRRISRAASTPIDKEYFEGAIGQLDFPKNAAPVFRGFIAAEHMNGFSPVEFPEVSLDVHMENVGQRVMNFTRSEMLPTHEDPSLWSRVRFIES